MNLKDKLNHHFELLKSIRDFFSQQGFLDVLTPIAVENPGIEPHIHPFQLYSAHKNETLPYYLHTSPEFHMKELLSLGFEKIFTLNYSFRQEPTSAHHRQQFVMLEWYRANTYYDVIKSDVKKLIQFCQQRCQSPKDAPLAFQEVSVADLFLEFLHFDILEFLDASSLKEKIKSDFRDVPLPKESNWEWDDYFFLLFLNKIEPELAHFEGLIVDRYPAPLCALSTLNSKDPRVCERFEVYLKGVEIANCFNELTVLSEQKTRWLSQQELKEKLYHYRLCPPTQLFRALENLPPCSGIALGVERLLAYLIDLEDPFYSQF